MVDDSSGRPVRVVLLTHLDLTFCIPFTLLSLAYLQIYIRAFELLRAVAGILFALFTRCNINLIASFILFPCFIAAACVVSAYTGSYSPASSMSAVAVFMLGATLLSKLIIQESYIVDPHAREHLRGNASPSEVHGFARMRAEASALPDPCVRNVADKHLLYLCILKGLLITPAFICMLLVPNGWLNYALIAIMVLFLFNDFELIEHISSHSARGKLLITDLAPWWATVAEGLRRYLAWPLFGWFPDYYFVTHALHHHVENNGPADWQSTLRYDRSSVLEFAKAVTWFGINTLLCIDTIYYLIQKRRLRILKLLLRGMLLYAALLTVVAYLEPLLFLILISYRLLLGIGMYGFVGRWHGLHNPQRPYDIQACSQQLVHYAHHAKPRVHLFDGEALHRVAQSAPRPSPLMILKPEFSFAGGFWRLQALLWRKDFERAAECVVAHDMLTSSDKAGPFTLRTQLVEHGIGAAALQELVAAVFRVRRPSWLSNLDTRWSDLVGRLLLRGHASRAAPPIDLPE